jgi:signal transduction histidine kinase
VVLTDGLLVAFGVFTAGLAAASAIDWDRMMGRDLGPWLAWIYAVLLCVGLGALATIPAMFAAAVPLFSGLVVFTGLVLERVRHVFVSVLAVGLLALGAFSTGNAGNLDALVIPALTVGVAAAATAVMGSEFERVSAGNVRRLEELNAQRADFERLYAVSTTLAGAESLAEGLPEIVGRICRFVDAQVGAVFLHRHERHVLSIISPMWVNGHELEVSSLETSLSGTGVLARAFRSGRAVRIADVSSHADRFGVLAELGISEAIVAPLRVESDGVGVIVVADPEDGSFDEADVEAVRSLAAAAALVLSQLGRFEAASEMSRRMAEIAQMKTDFVSVVSHELRTPLTSIIGSLDTVRRPELPADVADELVESARRQAGRLQRLIEDLLMVSRIDRHAVPITLEEVCLGDFLREIGRTVALDGLTISVEPEDLAVLADPDHLGRVFINLVENAKKYAPGSPVELVASPDGTSVSIAVVDHREGIPEDQRGRVFDRFTQLERADTRSHGGTGLGLSIVKGLTEAMDGRVSVAGTPGGGATFVVELPALDTGPAASSEALRIPG